MPTRILLARHGQSDWNLAGRWQGHADRPLSARGRSQALELAERLAATSLEAVYASDLRRAWETAAAVAVRHRLEVRRMRELREVDVGAWSGLTRGEVERRFPDAFRRWLAGTAGWEDGETYEQMAERVIGAVRTIAEAHPEGRVLVVSHGGPIRAIQARALGLDLHAYRRSRPVEPNAGLTEISVENGLLAWLD